MDTQTLRSTIKSCRDLMRKDEGLSSDIDRIPQLSWMLFLKCFNDHEKFRETKLINYKRVLPKNLRWDYWTDYEKVAISKTIIWISKIQMIKMRSLI